MKKDYKRNTGIAILMVCLFVVGFVAGRVFQANKSTILGTSSEKNVDFSLYWDVWNLMKSKYVDSSKGNEQDMVYGSIKGMVDSYGDAATVFLDPKETETFNETSEGKYFEGIGAELGYNNGQVIIVSPLEGSPAKAAGIRAGDIILAVDDKEVTSSQTVYDIVALIRGEANSQVKLKVLHKGAKEAVDITITRSEITVPSMSVKYVGDNKEIAVFKVNRFTDSTYNQWTKNWDTNVDAIVKSGAKKIILDLRGNPGGFFDAAVYAADDFLDEGYVISQQQDSKGSVEKFNSKKGGKLLNMDVLVLVDGGSASASEILSGALQQSKRATILGEKTYGKGTAQSVIDLTGGSSLHITVLKWLLPDGGWLNKDNPITPDLEVVKTDDDFLKGVDPQLDKAISLLSK
jgi:carboxyl-terminal processing protease